jgi:hypothetical protein
MASLALRAQPSAISKIPVASIATFETLANEIAAPPCFYWRVCSQRAAVEKTGRSVCRRCANRLRGREYPVRHPSLQPLYVTGRAVSEELDMIEN